MMHEWMMLHNFTESTELIHISNESICLIKHDILYLSGTMLDTCFQHNNIMFLKSCMVNQISRNFSFGTFDSTDKAYKPNNASAGIY